VDLSAAYFEHGPGGRHPSRYPERRSGRLPSAEDIIAAVRLLRRTRFFVSTSRCRRRGMRRNRRRVHGGYGRHIRTAGYERRRPQGDDGDASTGPPAVVDVFEHFFGLLLFCCRREEYTQRGTTDQRSIILQYYYGWTSRVAVVTGSLVLRIISHRTGRRAAATSSQTAVIGFSCASFLSGGRLEAGWVIRDCF